MTTARAIVAVFLVLVTALPAFAGAPSARVGAKSVPSVTTPEVAPRLLVKPFKRLRADQRSAAEAHRTQVGARMEKRFEALGGWEVLELPQGSDVESMRSKFIATGYYEAVEVDQEWRILATPNDPQYLNGTLWGLHNTGQAGGTNDADIDAPEGWDVRNSAQDVVVAVIDTGILATHEDLSANMWVNPGEIPGNGVDDDSNGYVDDVHGVNAITGSGNPTDDNGHGTHCAGTIGGVGNNGIGVTGVAWRVKLMACKFLSAQGSGTTSDAIEAIDYARRNGADIMSNSWGGGGYSQALFDAIAAARDAGIVFVAAAGNSALDNDVQANYPSNYLLENVLAVAATDRSEGIASFSNFGNGMVDLGAPGVDIRSTISSSNSAYDTYSGTSMATPHVSGALALIAAQFPNDTARHLINRICRSVDPASSLSGKTAT
ncbi:MAG: S8 family peptidase, partial [Chthoniobacterales bacterium]